MVTRSIQALSLIAALGGCGSSAPEECRTACQRVVTCSSTPYGYGYAYSFNFTYASSGYGLYYGGAELQSCLNDCAAVTQPARDRIAQCVIGASDCLTLLRCN